MVDEVLSRPSEFVAYDEVETLESDVNGAAVSAFAVDQDVLGRPDEGFVVGPQCQVGRAGDRNACGQLGLA
ncbi:hypothetical protein AMK16_33235 [Streptomyces sp. CB00455]|nr:hypothetical protein AMK16_33235 [Streptomyces sp. CB00455]